VIAPEHHGLFVGQPHDRRRLVNNLRIHPSATTPFLLPSSPSEHKQAQENETQKTETYNFAQQPMRMLLVKANDIVPASKRPEIFGNLEQLDRFCLQRGEEPGRRPVGDG
jgi:hypothetical protein